MGEAVTEPVAFFSGGGGLVSTAADYHRFTQMLARGGELDGVRLLGPRTVAYMTRNHLPGGVDLDAFGRPLFAESPFRGVGFGLGFSVVLDPVPGKVLSSAGEFAWGGLARTAFWVDPAEEITAMFFTQLLPGPCTRCARSCASSSRRRWWTDGLPRARRGDRHRAGRGDVDRARHRQRRHHHGHQHRHPRSASR